MTARWFLAAVPMAVGLAWVEAPPIAVSVAALAAIVPLVGVMGRATEHLAAKLGPTVGGWLTAEASWRWCFYINLPIGIAAFAVITAVIRSA